MKYPDTSPPHEELKLKSTKKQNAPEEYQLTAGNLRSSVAGDLWRFSTTSRKKINVVVYIICQHPVLIPSAIHYILSALIFGDLSFQLNLQTFREA